jgi:Zn-dependent metalloprotease
VCSFATFAQSITYNKNGSYASYDAFLKPYTTDQASEVLQNILKTDKFTSFVLYATETDALGYTHSRFQQYYKGVKIAGAVYFVHSKNNIITHINGDYRKINTAIAEPKIASSVALQQVLQQIGAAEYAWQNAAAEQNLRELRADSSASYFPKGELVWVRVEQTAQDIAQNRQEVHHLAYYYKITATKPDLHLAVYADAHTGKIIQQSSTICNILGDAQTRYSGTVQINTQQNAQGRYELIDTNTNGSISVRTQNGTNFAMSDNDNNWTQAEHRPSGDDVALDVHWGGANAQGYWKSVHGRNGYDNQGSTLNLVARAGMGGNAIWEEWIKTASFYDGDILFNPLTSLDVVGHEIGHGFNWSCGIDGENPATKSVHEGLSDIWGICLAYHNNKNNFWLLGAEIIKSSTQSCVRNLANPNDGAAILPSPDTYEGYLWANTGMHEKGVIIGHWFYLTAVGGSGTNDIGNTFNVSGISIEKAEKIAYRMASVYLTPHASFSDIAYGAMQAATDIYGKCSPELAAVTNALYAVNLHHSPYRLPEPPPFTTPPQIACWGSEIYMSLSYSGSVGVEWEVEGGNVHLIPNSDYILGSNIGARFVVDAFPVGFGTLREGFRQIRCKIKCRAGQQGEFVYLVSSHLVWIGHPNAITPMTNPTILCEGVSIETYIPPAFGATYYHWLPISPALYIENKGTNRANLYVHQGANVSSVDFLVVATNSCTPNQNFFPPVESGQYSFQYFSIAVESGQKCIQDALCPDPRSPCLQFVGYPNPVSNIYTISFKDESTTKNISKNFTYQIYNSLGISLLTGEGTSHQESKIDVSAWADGLYMVHLQNGDKSYYLKFVVQKGSIAN